jgi:hypothetical protein
MSNISIAMIACLKLSPASTRLTVSSSDVESAGATLVSLTGSFFWALSSCKQKRKRREEFRTQHLLHDTGSSNCSTCRKQKRIGKGVH